jgi:hypothetical protein
MPPRTRRAAPGLNLPPNTRTHTHTHTHTPPLAAPQFARLRAQLEGLPAAAAESVAGPAPAAPEPAATDAAPASTTRGDGEGLTKVRAPPLPRAATAARPSGCPVRACNAAPPLSRRAAPGLNPSQDTNTHPTICRPAVCAPARAAGGPPGGRPRRPHAAVARVAPVRRRRRRGAAGRRRAVARRLGRHVVVVVVVVLGLVDLGLRRRRRRARPGLAVVVAGAVGRRL